MAAICLDALEPAGEADVDWVLDMMRVGWVARAKGTQKGTRDTAN
jgi:hypothetical protein